MMDASTRAADWGARVINLSWGLDTRLSPNLVDRFYDDMVFHRFITVVKSAGNRGCQPTPPDGNVTTPGLAYNVITVGGFDDRGTEDRADDRMYDCSGLHDPLSRHGDRNKPELVAPAVEIDVVTSGPANIVRMSGTSLAAPLVAGAAALFIERQGLLAIWPEIHKALLMATATHNIEGARARSDADGAGALMANVGAQLLQDTRRWNGLRYTCSGSTPATLVLATLPGSRRQRHRVAIAWSTDPGDPTWPEQPSADIDLVVRDSGGRTVASSLSFDNSYEVVEFDNLSADTFTVEARRFRCDRDTWLGWAWHTQALARP